MRPIGDIKIIVFTVIISTVCKFMSHVSYIKNFKLFKDNVQLNNLLFIFLLY